MVNIPQARPIGCAREIVGSVRISRVYHALTGKEPRLAGSHAWRGPAVWRRGDGFNVSMDDTRGLWHDFVTGEGGGVLDLVQRVRGGDRAGALLWVADLSGLPLDNRKFTQEERRAYGRQRQRIEQLARDVADFEWGLCLITRLGPL